MKDAEGVRQEIGVGVGVVSDEVVVKRTVSVGSFDGLGMGYAWV